MFNRRRSLALRGAVAPPLCGGDAKKQSQTQSRRLLRFARNDTWLKWIAVPVALAFLLAYVAPVARADDPPGAKLFTNYCSGCHGAAGKGGMALAIGTEAYLNTHDDATITQITTNGVSGKGMPAWSKGNGGTLTDSQIADIVAYLRSFVAPVAPAPTAVVSTSEPVVYQQTKTTLTQSTNANGATVIVATLVRYDGTPAIGASVVFWRPTIMGQFELGTVKTDKQGNASLVVLDQPDNARTIIATFKGEPSLGSSEALITLQRSAIVLSEPINARNVRLAIGDEPLLAPEGSLITPYPPLLPTVLFLLVVGGIWSAYAFVMYQVVGIWKSGRIVKRENTFTARR
ncbi:MAG: cytochrome c [Chloroflexi bacterium]|nr:cytochrome c [Chloroflexota bacterium]